MRKPPKVPRWELKNGVVQCLALVALRLGDTSFNVRGEPIVCTPEDAFRCFMGTEIDLLVAENCVLRKEEQDPRLRLNYKAAFTPD